MKSRKYLQNIMSLLVILSVALLFVVAVEGQQRVCQPGAVFRVDCNTCRCNLYGTGMACTRKQCLPNFNPSSRPGSGSRKICEPGSYFKMDCNDCRCNDDGTNAGCTLKACI